MKTTISSFYHSTSFCFDKCFLRRANGTGMLVCSRCSIWWSMLAPFPFCRNVMGRLSLLLDMGPMEDSGIIYRHHVVIVVTVIFGIIHGIFAWACWSKILVIIIWKALLKSMTYCIISVIKEEVPSMFCIVSSKCCIPALSSCSRSSLSWFVDGIGVVSFSRRVSELLSG